MEIHVHKMYTLYNRTKGNRPRMYVLGNRIALVGNKGLNTFHSNRRKRQTDLGELQICYETLKIGLSESRY